MGTTAEKLQAIVNSKAAIKSAIETKGQTVGNAPLDEYAEKIKAIQSGFDGEVLTINVKTNQSDTPVPNTGIQVVIKYGTETITRNWVGSELSEKVPPGAQVEVSVTGTIANFRSPAKQSFISFHDNVRPLLLTYEAELVTVIVNTDNAVSCVGQKVTINGVEYTYSNPIAAKIPFGTAYSVSVNSKPGFTLPDAQSFTANQAARSVTITYPAIKRGIFILDTNGGLVKREDWNTSNNSKAVGVAVLSDNCKYVISPSENSSNIPWGGDGITINNIVTTTDSTIAKKDYAGSGNTDKIIAQLGSGNAPAAEYCRGVTFKHGEKGYLGALGEWQEAYNNKAEINACMSLIGGAAINTSGYHWTSTQYDSTISWILHWSGGNANRISKISTNRVRAFSAL